MKCQLQTLALAILTVLLTGCAPEIDNPLFDPEEITLLNNGGSIDSTNDKFANSDEVCLIGPDILNGYEYRGCILNPNQAIALIKNGQCTLYSLDGFDGRVFFQHDHECQPVSSGFELKTFDRYGTKHLIFSDE